MLSSADFSGDTARCRQLGIAFHLMKPITQAELWDAIMTGLNRPGHTRAPVPTATPSPGHGMPHPLRILLAEDNRVNQMVAIRMLEKQGHAVTVVGDGQAALTALAQASFDLVLMDIQMPVMDGLEATTAIRAQDKTQNTHVPIIAMTAHAMRGDRERCLAAGMNGYVSKPIKAEDLAAAIASLLYDAPQLEAPAVEPPLDFLAALSNVDGDKALLVDMLEVFLLDSPKQLLELRDAIGTGDAGRTARIAHSLKGSLSYFGVQTAYALALQLETMGRRAELDGASCTLQQLEQALEQISAFVAEAEWAVRV
jgi:CheY-like chemotaxis protein/HPt (histidine-containing phosphotransfer) domain-containing protein